MHICFIDDQFEEIRPLAESLAERNVAWSHCDWADNGERLFKEHINTTDLVVLLDLYFYGKLKAPEIIGHLRKLRPDVPVIVFTQQDDYANAFASAQWGAKGYFVKACTDHEKLWTEIQRVSREAEPNQVKLSQAIADAQSSDPSTCHRGLLACEELIASAHPRPHLLALQGRRKSLATLAGLGTKQNLVPLKRIIDDLWDTCRSLNKDDFGLERDNLRIWWSASFHSGRDAGELARFAISRLDHDDSLIRQLITETLHHRKGEPAVDLANSVMNWLDDAEPQEELRIFLRLTRAVLAMNDYVAIGKVVANRFVAKLSENSQAGFDFVQQRCDLGDEKLIAEILASGDCDGKRSDNFLFRVLEDRLAQADKGAIEDGPLLRSTVLVGQLRKWKSPIMAEARAQEACANLAFYLHCGGHSGHRDEVLKDILDKPLHSPKAGKIVVELLLDVDTNRLPIALNKWIVDCDSAGRTEVSDALLNEVKRLGPKRWRDAGADALLHVATVLQRRNEHQAEATEFLVDAIDQALKDLPFLARKKREDEIQKWWSVLAETKKTAAPEVVNPLTRRLERVHAQLINQNGPLVGQLVVVIGGRDNLLQEYKTAVEKGLGATCRVVGVDCGEGDVDAVCDKIEYGNVHTVVLIKGAAKHAMSEKVEGAIERRRSRTKEALPYYIKLPMAMQGAGSIVRNILDVLGSA